MCPMKLIVTEDRKNEILKQALADLKAKEKSGWMLKMELTHADAWILLAQLQLALRHEKNVGPSADRMRAIALWIESQVATTDALQTLAQWGWQSEKNDKDDEKKDG